MDSRFNLIMNPEPRESDSESTGQDRMVYLMNGLSGEDMFDHVLDRRLFDR